MNDQNTAPKPKGPQGHKHPSGDAPLDALERLYGIWHPEPAFRKAER